MYRRLAAYGHMGRGVVSIFVNFLFAFTKMGQR